MKRVFGTIWRAVKSVWAWLCRVAAWLGCFCNILEPNTPAPVLSISKIGMWGTMIATIYIAFHNPSGSEIATALGAQLTATLSYAYRRKLQADNKLAGYSDATKEEEV